MKARCFHLLRVVSLGLGKILNRRRIGWRPGWVPICGRCWPILGGGSISRLRLEPARHHFHEGVRVNVALRCPVRIVFANDAIFLRHCLVTRILVSSRCYRLLVIISSILGVLFLRAADITVPGFLLIGLVAFSTLIIVAFLEEFSVSRRLLSILVLISRIIGLVEALPFELCGLLVE